MDNKDKEVVSKESLIEQINQYQEILNQKQKDIKMQNENISISKKKHRKQDKLDKKIEVILTFMNFSEDLKQHLIRREVVIKDESFKETLESTFVKKDNDLLKLMQELTKINYNFEKYVQQNKQQKQGPSVQQNVNNLTQSSRFSEVDFPDRETQPLNYLLSMIETSHKNLQKSSDYVPPRFQKVAQNQQNHFLPRKNLISEGMYEKFNEDTLFYIFYYQKNSYEQYLAAKELKKRHWRFHKQYITWFRRLEQPKSTNEKQEEGTFVFFDHEQGQFVLQ